MAKIFGSDCRACFKFSVVVICFVFFFVFFSCLVLTTEILRSMLYRGSELLREVTTVIFDEIHYMRDRERGVVWEETIILLPKSIQLIFLSATLANATEFAAWISSLKQSVCHVITTDFRPVPLLHYAFPEGSQSIYLIEDEKGIIHDNNITAALNEKQRSIDEKEQQIQLRRQQQRSGLSVAPPSRSKSSLFRLLELCCIRGWLPLICFTFSRRECEASALMLSKLDLTDQQEKTLIQQVFQKAMEGLTGNRQQTALFRQQLVSRVNSGCYLKFLSLF